MYNRLFLLLSALLLNTTLFAQTARSVKGLVQDSTGTGVFSATVKLFPSNAGPSDTVMTRSDVDGNFTFRNVGNSGFRIRVSSLGYESSTTTYNFPNDQTSLFIPAISLKAGSRMIDEVIVNGTPPVLIKTDTIQFNVSDLKLKPDAVVEDAIKRLDGAEVDKDGNVTAAGKAVTKIKVDGKEIFGGDMQTITKNIPADAIDKIQLVEDYGDQAAFTGTKDGEPETIINITTKPGRNRGVIMNATVGGGTEERYQAGVFASQFLGDRNLGITANLNNNGTQVGGGNFGGRFGARGGAFQRGGGGGAGITNLGSLGLNYNNKWGPNVKVSAAYYFNNSDRNTISKVFRQSANSLGTILSDEFSTVDDISTSHAFSGRFEYLINPSNQLIVTPFLSFSKSTNDNSGSVRQTGVIYQDQTSVSNSTSTTPSINGNVLFNHRFKKEGRNYSLNFNFRNSHQESDQGSDNHIVYYDATGNTLQDSINYRLNATRNRTFSGSGRAVYNEPISETGRIQVSYHVNYNNYDNSRISSLEDDLGVLQPIDSLSNVFQYSFISQRMGLNYNFKNKNNDLSLGMTANPTYLSGNSPSLNTTISRSNFFIAPIARYQYRFGGTKSLTVNYWGSSAEPQFSQLQPVRDVSNPQRAIVGNPDLNSSFAHTLDANFRTSNPENHSSLMLSLQANAISNQIVQNIVLIPDVYQSRKQEVRFVNTNGYYTYFGRYDWQKSFADRQYTIRIYGDTRFTRSVALADNIKNFSERRNISQRVSMEINPGDWMEITPRLAYINTVTNYTLETNTDTRLKTYSFDLDGRLLFLRDKSLVFGFNGAKTYNDGYVGNLNTNPVIVNSYIEKKFRKNTAYVRLQGFDLLDQSNNISRTVVENGFTDSETNRLTQYFMLTLNMRINKFAGKSNTGPGPGDRTRGFERSGPPNGGMRRGNF